MWDNMERDRHYTGIFTILDEQIPGELIYNKKNGVILLNIVKELSENHILGKSYATLKIIIGKLNSGAVVTLFNNHCVNNRTHIFQTQRLNFRAEYMLWSNAKASDCQYNKMVCVLRNAYAWSGLSAFEECDSGIKAAESEEPKTYNWFGATIRFSTYLNNCLTVPPHEEETTIIQRLILEIETDAKKELQEFVDIKNKIVALISFAIKDNVNVEEEYLLDYNDSYTIGNGIVHCHKHYLFLSESQLDILGTERWNYNFILDQLPTQKDINKELSKLSPIFNLYLSLFKYRDMPVEMVFLNIVQALETFHSRFFYGDKKENYVKSVMERFGTSPSFTKFEKLLLCDTQKDSNCSYIILVSRLNDLLIGRCDGLFDEYYWKNESYAQTIADTRHYYTHYGKSKEAKALKKDDLLEAIYILRILLEYHICLVLGVDNRERIAKELNKHNSWKYLSEMQSKECTPASE